MHLHSGTLRRAQVDRRARSILSKLAPFIAALAISGCNGRSDDEIDLSRFSPGHRVPYATALGAAYQGQADIERAAGTDPAVIDILTERAAIAARGQIVDPLQPASPAAEGETLAEFVRVVLLDALSESEAEGYVWSKMNGWPATAQVAFDCWLLHGGTYPPSGEIAAECWERVSHIHPRLEEMVRYSHDIDFYRLCGGVFWSEPLNHVVLFDWGASEITTPGAVVLFDFSCRWKLYRDLPVSIVGHADSSEGSLELSIMRAEAIRDGLIAEGIDPRVIRLEGRGDSDPAVPTGAGVRNQANRRAVLMFL
jgi:outer membrane protein OmpA-like peptidoglycan-associated protein